jgi:hypothetical protein
MLEYVNVPPDPETVAGAVITIWVPPEMDAMDAPVGMPAPAIPIPVKRPAVLGTVTVALPETVVIPVMRAESP